jgi:hypothetical protein
MSETVEVRLARIEEMLRAHFLRIDDRCTVRTTELNGHAGRIESLEVRVNDLEAWQDKTKGGWAVLSAVSAASAAAGALVVKLGALLVGRQ